MDSEKILSDDEKDALTRAGQQVDASLSEIFSQSGSERRRYERTGQPEIIDCIVASFLIETEKAFSSFFRKKTAVSFSKNEFGDFNQFVAEETKDKVFTLFYVLSGNYFCLIVLDLKFLHQMQNVLFGGSINNEEASIENAGKMGIIIAEKISTVIMSSFSQACHDYSNVDYQFVRSSTLPILVTRMGKDSRVYSITADVVMDNFHGEVNFLVTADYIFSMSAKPQDSSEEKQDNADRKMIESLMLDSEVTLVASLPETRISASELMKLNVGDLLPISNPSNVIITAGRKQLFTGVAGQSNSALVVKLTEKL